jgi:hypothetical protein
MTPTPTPDQPAYIRETYLLSRVQALEAAGKDPVSILMELDPLNRDLGEPVWLPAIVYRDLPRPTWDDYCREQAEHEEALDRLERRRRQAPARARRRRAERRLARLFRRSPLLRRLLREHVEGIIVEYLREQLPPAVVILVRRLLERQPPPGDAHAN